MRSSVLLLLCFICLSFVVSAQHSLKVKVIDADTEEILPGANVVINNTTIGNSTGADGIAELKDLKAGQIK